MFAREKAGRMTVAWADHHHERGDGDCQSGGGEGVRGLKQFAERISYELSAFSKSQKS